MPAYLLRPALRKVDKLTWKVIREMADIFETSHTAMAIRMVESDNYPAMLICHTKTGRRWFTSAPCVPVSRWFPTDQLSPDSMAFDVVFGAKTEDPFPRKIPADCWFDRYEAARFQIHEQSTRTHGDEVLTLLTLSATMCEDA